MTEFDMLIDLHVGNDRQGPGADRETRRALELCGSDDGEPLAVADVGCGTGASALVLAEELNARVTAIDAAAVFIDRLRERAAGRGLRERIDAQTGQMEQLPFGESSLDVIWSEGAIYNIGFARGLAAWRRFLRPRGVVAVSELSWFTVRRPEVVEDYWSREYPDIGTIPENMSRLEHAGYDPIGCFVLPAPCWTENYYRPLDAGFDDFLDRHGRSEAAMSLVDAHRAESNLYDEYGTWYGYAFYIGRKSAD